MENEDRPRLFWFVLAAFVVFGLATWAVVAGAGIFADPVGPLRYVLGGLLLLVGLPTAVASVKSREFVPFVGGCAFVAGALATLLGAHCPDCPNV